MHKYKIHILTIVAFATIVIYANFFREPEIMVTDHELNFYNIAVKNFPLTERNKINWWKKNRAELKKKIDISPSAISADWYISIWNYSNGFQPKPKGDIRIFNSETEDMICFNKSDQKCLEKDLIMRIENNREGGENILIGDKKISVKG